MKKIKARGIFHTFRTEKKFESQKNFTYTENPNWSYQANLFDQLKVCFGVHSDCNSKKLSFLKLFSMSLWLDEFYIN